MSICVRSIFENFIIYEDFLGLNAVDATDTSKRLVRFKKLQCNILDKDVKQINLSAPCSTRFTVRTKSNGSILINFHVIVLELQEITESNDPNRAKAEGLLDKLLSFKLYFGPCLAYEVFATVEQVSQHMQSAEIDAQTIASSTMLLKNHISSMGLETRFKSFFESCVNEGVHLKFGYNYLMLLCLANV
ncbi:uncharacterized protein LOC136077137 [Hydra vulgaris]|uniref:Uncharacterized protein LOC136077137 n=1 Tax=Hydra vulgaris TaxID=6087 RepID=A0ABM4BFY1_HYDVU